MAGVTDWARTVGNTVRSFPRSLPSGTLPYLARSMRELRKVRTPGDAVAAFETETERLLGVIMPKIVERPLPVRTVASAKALVAATGGMAAAGQEIEALGVLISGGSALPPALPIMLGTLLLALATEMSVAASLRVHDLEAAGIEPDANAVARDVMIAMTGGTDSDLGTGSAITKNLVKAIVTRVLSRWSKSLVPVVGILHSSWDAQRTIDAIRARPLPEPKL
ncbi:MAG: hypothetical protein EXQ79_00300 [Acidimicrobiia bacterium]|nr:hypothetical protein [Acidimicrobiia bacterium]